MAVPRANPAALLALLALACGRSEPSDERASAPRAAASPAATADAPRVVFLGDSLAAGFGVEPDEAFPSVVAERLAREGHPIRLVNAGVSGDTSAGGLRRLDWVLRQEPDVLVLELGGNDGLRAQRVSDIAERLSAIITGAQEAGARVLLLGVRLPPSLGADYVEPFERMYADLAEETGCAYLPFFMEGAGGVRAMMQADGIHPNRAGHARIAENVAPALAGVLEALAEAR